MPTPSVDFYLLNTPNRNDMYRFLCRLVDQIYLQNTLLIRTNSDEETKYIDELLWTFKDISFIPHEVITYPSMVPSAISIAISSEKKEKDSVLINLNQEPFDSFSEFKRILELVYEEKKSKNQSRKKYKFYKEKNCQLTLHSS